MGRVLDAVFAAREQGAAGHLLTRVHLTAENERELRDADLAQIGAAGLAAARGGDTEAWREFLRGHLRVRIDLVPVFDARRLRAE